MQKTTLQLASLMLLFAVLISCKKTSQEDASPMQGETLQKLSAKVGGKPPSPTVENGILVFKDQQHFKAYIDYLDKITDPQSYDTATLMKEEFDQDAILEAVESQLGFTSIRKISHDKFMQLNEIGWNRLEDIPEEHFIRDVVFKSVLNQNLTVKIGGNYVHVINKNLSVEVDATADAKILQAFTRLPVTTTLESALNIDPVHRYSTVFEVSQSGNSNIFTKDLHFKPTGAGSLYIMNLKYDAPDCSNSKVQTFSNMILYQDFGPSSPAYLGPGKTLPATFTIDFGDNTPVLIVHTISSGGSDPTYTVPTLNHLYPAAGVFTMKIHAQADWVYGGALTTYADRSDDIPIATTCKNSYKEGEEEYFPVPDGSRAISGKISMVSHYSFWHEDYYRVLSETNSWLKDGDKWKQSKSEIWAKLHTDRKDKSCNITGQTDGDGWSSNSKHIQVHRTDPPYYWYQINTEHGIKYHNTWYVHNKILNVCQ